MGSAKRKVPSGRGPGRPPKVRRGSKASAVTSSSPIASVKKIDGKADTASANEAHMTSNSQSQDEEEDYAGGRDGNGEEHVMTAVQQVVAKRGRGRPKKIPDTIRADDIKTGTPPGPAETAEGLGDEDEDDSKIWGIESHNWGVEIQDTASSPLQTATKRGRGRPRKSVTGTTFDGQIPTPDSGTKRGRGRPRKSDSKVTVGKNTTVLPNTSSQRRTERSRTSDAIKTVDQDTTLPPSTSSLRHLGRPKKASDLAVTVNQGPKHVDGSVLRQNSSATEDTEEEDQKMGKKEEDAGENEEEIRDQKEPEVRQYDVHKASPASTKVGLKRKREVPEVQDNAIDTLSSTPRTIFKPATLRDFGQPQQVDMNTSNPALNALRSTLLDFKDDSEAAGNPTGMSPAKRPRLLPSAEFTRSITLTSTGTPNAGSQDFARVGMYHNGTGMDGSPMPHEEHTTKDLAIAALQELQGASGTSPAGDNSPGLQLTEVFSQNLVQPSQPEQSLLGPSMLATRKTNLPSESSKLSTFSKLSRVFGSRSDLRANGDGVLGGPGSASEGALFSDSADTISFSNAVNADTGPYHGVNGAGVVAPVAPMLAQDEWSETMLKLGENRDVE
ncbi:hypothetical protein MMC18_001569 [Xylographa bjoerkii]|nr:hypothetical protein [Xylographa bjoerkii]